MTQTSPWNYIKAFCQRWDISFKNKTLLLAYSGGLDSTVLFHVMALKKEELAFNLLGAHVNHNLRESSGEDKKFCQAQFENLGLRFESLDLNPAHKKKGESLEMWGRRERYGFFQKLLQKHGAHYLLTAHHQDDQLETLLLRIERGASLLGLRGIHPKRDFIIRPLLECPRQCLENYAREHGLKWREDVSNEDIQIPRNYLRQEYIPRLGHLKKQWMEKASSITGQLYQLVQSWESEWEKRLRRNEKGEIEFSKAVLEEGMVYELGLEREFFAFVSGQFGVEISGKFLVELKKQLKAKSQVKISLGKGLWLYSSGPQLRIREGELESWGTNSKYEELVFSKLEKSSIFVGFWKGRKISLKANNYVRPLDFSPPRLVNQRVFLDGGRFSSTLIIRNRKNGDRFKPLGLSGKPQKLKDFFIKRKVSREQRENQILVCDGENIVWMPNLEISENYKVTEDTEQILELEISWQ